LSDIWNTLGALVGASAVVAAVAGFVPKFIADRKIESHKTDLARELERLKSELSNEAGIPKWRLKRAELLFAKQVEAGSAFIALRQRICPKYAHPDKDWDEACMEIVESFEETEGLLKRYIIEHGTVLSEAVGKKLDESIETASGYQFVAPQFHPAETKPALLAAQSFLKGLATIQNQMLSEIRD
jgi:hypothetical protein